MSNHPITQVTDNEETSAQTPSRSTWATSAAARFRQLLAAQASLGAPFLIGNLPASGRNVQQPGSIPAADVCLILSRQRPHLPNISQRVCLSHISRIVCS
jgi:hypothetical protein